MLNSELSLTDLILWRLTFDRRIAKYGADSYVNAGLCAYQTGESLGKTLQTANEGLGYLLDNESIKVRKRETHPSGPLAIRAWLDTGKKEIVLFLSTLKRIEHRLPWTADHIESIAIAHEYFHYLQTQGQAESISVKYQLVNVGTLIYYAAKPSMS
ncbi:hypothetical protein QUF84_18310 [Fictibacillus enclensis]|uniref:hypothetical protein n=1 Tax=Fictibacillus enclensis TaxID=1017270 RepID=UPI0025A0015F|nr:hypothetical protein [Fictibacillus enclensis]MDM5339156.1 hypothetical protein [Fictibacillus enclensis]